MVLETKVKPATETATNYTIPLRDKTDGDKKHTNQDWEQISKVPVFLNEQPLGPITHVHMTFDEPPIWIAAGELILGDKEAERKLVIAAVERRIVTQMVYSLRRYSTTDKPTLNIASAISILNRYIRLK